MYIMASGPRQDEIDRRIRSVGMTDQWLSEEILAVEGKPARQKQQQGDQELFPETLVHDPS
jgi:hypothetical protein